jgi:hypothetical protein
MSPNLRCGCSPTVVIHCYVYDVTTTPRHACPWCVWAQVLLRICNQTPPPAVWLFGSVRFFELYRGVYIYRTTVHTVANVRIIPHCSTHTTYCTAVRSTHECRCRNVAQKAGSMENNVFFYWLIAMFFGTAGPSIFYCSVPVQYNSTWCIMRNISVQNIIYTVQ